MNEQTKKASGVTFALLVLFGVALVTMYAVNQIVEGNVIVRDSKDGDGTLRRLLVNETVQAGQYLPPPDPRDWKTTKDLSRLPVTYYHPEGPVGAALAKFNWDRGIANAWRADARLPASLVGLGWTAGPLPSGPLVAPWSEPPLAAMPIKAGAVAAYARPFQIVDFYEPNPAIHELSFPKAGDPKFTFLRDAMQRGAGIRVFQGNERELLAKQAPKKFYRALFVDTVRGELADLAEDLLTTEGLSALLAAITDDGVIGFHVSNTQLKIAPVIAESAQALGLVSVVGVDRGERGKGHYASEWVFVARGGNALRGLNRGGGAVRWDLLVGRGHKAWTDAGKHDRTGLERRQD